MQISSKISENKSKDISTYLKSFEMSEISRDIGELRHLKISKIS